MWKMLLPTFTWLGSEHAAEQKSVIFTQTDFSGKREKAAKEQNE
jgi:hypothetical protein